MNFEIIGPITEIETFAVGASIRELPRLQKAYGKGRWRKGKTTVRLANGSILLAEVHCHEAAGIGRKEFKIKYYLDSTPMQHATTETTGFVICIRNNEYPVSLEPRKIYPTIHDSAAAEHHQLRVVDESGEDYLYPEEYFIPVELPVAVQQALKIAA